MEPEFNRQRLTLARKRLGWTSAALARESGLSTRTLSNYENGHAVPSDEALAALSSVLRVTRDFFFMPEPEEVPVKAVSFRALSKMTAKQRESALAVGSQIVEFDTWLSAQFRFPQPNVPTLPGYVPEVAAATVRARWGLGERPIQNMVHLLEANGVRVYSLPSHLSELDAFSFYREEDPFVLMSTRKSAERSRFDAAHELGHLVLHCEHESPRGPEAEGEANQFAAAFLMPRASVQAAGLVNATVPMILRAKLNWGVAAMALTHRLKELDMLTEWGYRDLCVQLSRQGFRRSEPGGIPREQSERLRQALALLRQEGSSTSALATQSGIQAGEFRSWLNGITLQVA